MCGFSFESKLTIFRYLAVRTQPRHFLDVFPHRWPPTTACYYALQAWETEMTIFFMHLSEEFSAELGFHVRRRHTVWAPRSGCMVACNQDIINIEEYQYSNTTKDAGILWNLL
jgi:hypothetical protein